MRSNAFYTCPECGANLDYGEKCDCQEERAKREEERNVLFEKVLKTEKNGQLCIAI